MEGKAAVLEGIVPVFFHIADRYCYPDWYVQPARREFHNMMFVVSGEGKCFSEGKEISISGGFLIYHFPGQSFGFTSSTKDPMHCFGMNFILASVDWNKSGWSASNIDRLPLENVFYIEDMDYIIKDLEILFNIWNFKRHNCRLKCGVIFCDILYKLAHYKSLTELKPAAVKKIKQAVSYIEKYYKKRITLKLLSDICGLNPSYFGSLFKQYTGRTPIEFVNRTRIEKSLDYLAAGCTISEAAASSGFEDPFYYSKVFKKIKGSSPRDYIKNEH